jgi:hypothetical protein
MSTRWSKWTFRVVHAWIGLTAVGVLLLTACSDGGGPERMTQPPPAPPPPVATPPVPAKPDVVLGVIVFEVGGSRVVLRNGTNVQVSKTTTITANGRMADFDELRPGRVVLVRHDPGNSAATRIDAYDLLVGPLDSVDTATARLVVMGQRVVVTGHTAVGQSSVKDGALAALLPGSPVAVSGQVTATGEVLATRIDTAADDGLLLRGLVQSADAATSRLTIGGVDVDYGQAAWDSGDFPGGMPAVGDEVIVRAKQAPSGNLLLADSMEHVPRWFGAIAGTRVELNGVITRRTSSHEFDVAGRAVQLECDVYICEDMAEHLLENAEARFSGWMIADGTVHGQIVADDFWSRAVSLTGPVSAIDLVTGTLSLPGVRVQLSELTQGTDESGTVAPAKFLNDLGVGDTIDASGSHGGVPGLLLASSARRVPARDTEIRGWQFARDEPQIVMLGRAILTDAATAVDVCGAPSDAATLFSMNVYAIEELRIRFSATESGSLRAARVTINDGNCW